MMEGESPMEQHWREGRTECPKTVYGDCPWCGHEIQPGESVMALWLQREREAPVATPIPEVDVLASDGVMTLCIDCGAHLDTGDLRELISGFYAGLNGWAAPGKPSVRERVGWWILGRGQGHSRVGSPSDDGQS